MQALVVLGKECENGSQGQEKGKKGEREKKRTALSDVIGQRLRKQSARGVLVRSSRELRLPAAAAASSAPTESAAGAFHHSFSEFVSFL